MSARLIPFGKFPMVTVTGQRMYFGSGDSWEIRGYSPGGELERILRWDRSPRPVTDDLLSAYIRQEEAEAADEGEAREVRQRIMEMPVPDFLPAYSGMVADELGCLWVERFRPPEDDVPVFDIFDPEGALMARATLPEGSEVVDIGADQVLVLYRDDLGVEYLRVHPLDRRSSGAGG
jgi:hypothetical protein